ncbi:MAG TPA: VOC family protein [Bryobacteraceae bacterium]|jgi:lactoylglutathione lyase
MIPIEGLFETHLTVRSLERSIAFYRDKLGLTLAREFPERRVAFFWIGAPGSTMLGLWESGDGPNRMQLHIAFRVTIEQIEKASAALKAAGIAPLDFNGEPTEQLQALAWMPAVSIYFRDPDGHMLEFLTMLDGDASSRPL